ncbi:glutamyl aminopeptidase-like isoform X2 [Periplaneta americana]
MTSLSVMPIEATKPADEEGYEWDHFFPTMPLSTFSMNFMIHQFNKKKYINVPAKQGNISVCIHYQEQIPGDSYIFIEGSILASLINYLDDYLGIEYSLPKLDIVKLPQLQLMAQGSTLGLITLSNIDANSRRPQLARELANQLLNHMVTPQWWNDFILTDMLGNFLLNYIFDKIQPEGVRYMMDRTILYEYEKYTWYHDQRRWNPYVVWTDEWFLHMLNNSLTGSTVQKGIRNLYTERINTTNTFSGREMWDAINRQARLDGTLADSPTVENIANSWLGRQAPHFPAVTVTRNYEDGSALLEQHLFHGESHNVTEEERDFMWWIPIAYITPDNMDVDSIHPVSWMGERTHNIGNLPDMQSFVIMNPIDAGMFLVNYDQHNWGLISSNLQSSECKIPKVTHKKLLQDALLLTSARELNISTTFNLTLSLCNETDLSVWEPFVISLFFIRNDFELTPIEEKLQAYLRPLLGPTLERSDPTNYIWKIIRLLLTSIGYQPYIDGLSYMNKIIPTFPLLDSDTGLLLYCPEFMKNNSDDWETYVYKLQLFIEAKNFFWKYLSKCPGHLDLIEKILNGVANEGTTWKLSTWNSISSLLTKSRTAHNMTFNFLLENVDQLVEKYRASNKESYMANLVQFVFENIKSEEQFNKGKEFLDKYQVVSETIRHYVSDPKFHKKNLFDKLQQQVPDLENWLDKNLPTFKC